MNELNVGSERVSLRFKMSFPVWSIILGLSVVEEVVVVVELRNSTKISSAEKMERNEENGQDFFFPSITAA